MVQLLLSPEFQYNPGLFEKSIEMVENWLTASWRLAFPDQEPLATRIVRSVDDMRSFQSGVAQENANSDQAGDGKPVEIKYPFSQLLLTNISPDTDKAAFNKRLIPRVTGRAEDNSFVRIANIIPVRVGIGVTIRTDNLSHIVLLSHLLMFSAPRLVLRLQNDSGFVFECAVSIDPEITVPGADLGYPSKEFRFDTTFILSTYMVREKVQGVIRNIIFSAVSTGGGEIELGKYDDYTTLFDNNLKYTDLLDKNSKYYRAE